MKELNCKVIMEANDVRLDDGGSKFVIDQILSLNIKDEDTIVPIQIQITDVNDDGVILDFDVLSNGEYLTISTDPYELVNDEEGSTPALFTVDWKIKSVSIIDSYYMFPHPYVTLEHNTNGEVKPIVDCKGYLYDLALTKAGFGFTQQPVLTVHGVSESEIYYKVWQGEIIDENRMKSMTDTISHFEKLGYNIERRVNSETGNTFEWVVSWNS